MGQEELFCRDLADRADGAASDLRLYRERWRVTDVLQHRAWVSIRHRPFLFTIRHLITTGVNEYLHTPPPWQWLAGKGNCLGAKLSTMWCFCICVLKVHNVGTQACPSPSGTHTRSRTDTHTHTHTHTHALGWLRCRASSEAQCRQCARCAAFNHQRCATGPTGLPNSLLQHYGKWSREFIEQGRRDRGERRGRLGDGVWGGDKERGGKFMIRCDGKKRRKRKEWSSGSRGRKGDSMNGGGQASTGTTCWQVY